MDSLEGDKSDKQHLVDAVDLLDKLETDLGSVSLDFGPREHLEPALPLAGSNRDAASSGLTGGGGGGGGGGGRETTPATAYAAAACLVRILKALPEPVVETRLYEAAIRSDSREAAYEVLHSLKEVVRSPKCCFPSTPFSEFCSSDSAGECRGR